MHSYLAVLLYEPTPWSNPQGQMATFPSRSEVEQPPPRKAAGVLQARRCKYSRLRAEPPAYARRAAAHSETALGQTKELRGASHAWSWGSWDASRMAMPPSFLAQPCRKGQQRISRNELANNSSHLRWRGRGQGPRADEAARAACTRASGRCPAPPAPRRVSQCCIGVFDSPRG